MPRTMTATIELTIRYLPDAGFIAELRGLELLPDTYGAALMAMAIPAALHAVWERARGMPSMAGDLIRVAQAYLTPEAGYVAVHRPAFTVTSGILGGGVVVVGGVAIWLGRRWLRRRKITRLPSSKGNINIERAFPDE